MNDGLERYDEPQIEEWGSVTDLTQTGLTNPGGDGKTGSADNPGN
jgi:hypothetical protein